MVNWKSKKLGAILTLANGLVMLILINILSSFIFFRADLTEEKRYSIKEPTKKMLQGLEDDIYVEVYLSGDLNPGFQRFQKAIRETLEAFRIYSGNKIQYVFTDPSTAISEKAQSEFMSALAAKGVQPTRVFDKKDGQRIEKMVFPGAVISYRNAERGVMLLKGNKASASEEVINQSIEGIEFELANAIFKLTNDSPKRVGLVTGHGELDGPEAAAFENALFEVYDAGKISLLSKDLYNYDALIIAKPTTSFSPLEKYKLDQYIMQRGNVLFLLDKLEANIDSISRKDYFSFPYNLDLDDQLFRYGIRINPDLIQDRISGKIPVGTGQSGDQPQFQMVDWPFFPLINRYANHPITTNLDAVLLPFVSTIDTVKAEGVKKTPLLFTSGYSRTLIAPVNVSLQTLRSDIKAEDFTKQFLPVSYLLEGKFTSLFKNRFLPEGEDPKIFKADGRPAKIIVVADGDLARNTVNPRTRQPQPLGFDPFSNYTFANQDLLMNMLAYLLDEDGLIKARNKEIKIRLLDKERIVSEKLQWQIVNLLIPIVLIIVFGVVRTMLRKKRYASF